MGYHSILVLLDHGRGDEQCTTVAIRLARQLHCHVTGLAPTGLVELPATTYAAGALSELAVIEQDELRELAARSTRAFAERCRAAGLHAYDTVIDAQDFTRSLLHRSHCSDLVLLAQAEAGSDESAQTQQMIEHVVLGSARPVLILPYAGMPQTLGRRVMVAWDDSTQAARAVADAMPLLVCASQVEIVTWNEGGNAARNEALHAKLAALKVWLKHHGVSASVHVEVRSIPIAEAILSRVADQGADLLVMGAYGHSRWGERLLGGATRGLLRSMTVPVLMSH